MRKLTSLPLFGVRIKGLASFGPNVLKDRSQKDWSYALRQTLRLHSCAGLRAVAHALLKGTDRNTIRLADGPLAGAETVASLEYLRDRVGVPRDLPLPAARQLRAHLNLIISELRH